MNRYDCIKGKQYRAEGEGEASPIPAHPALCRYRSRGACLSPLPSSATPANSGRLGYLLLEGRRGDRGRGR